MVDLDLSLTESDVLVDSFKTLEKKVVDLRNDLVEKVDGAMQEIAASNDKTVEDVNRKLDKLDTNLNSNKSELEKISSQLSVIVDLSKKGCEMSEETIKNVAKNVAEATLEENSFNNFEKTLLEVMNEGG